MCKQRTEKRKYDLCDDREKRILHVTIYNLDLRDTGTYWCEIDTNSFDPKIEIDLKVHKGMFKSTILFLSFYLYFLLYSFFFLSLTAPAPVKPQPVPLNPPIQTTVEAVTMTQQQSARTTGYINYLFYPLCSGTYLLIKQRHIHIYQIHLHKHRHLSGGCFFFFSVTVDASVTTVGFTTSEDVHTGNTSHTAVYSDHGELGTSKRGVTIFCEKVLLMKPSGVQSL